MTSYNLPPERRKRERREKKGVAVLFAVIVIFGRGGE